MIDIEQIKNEAEKLNQLDLTKLSPEKLSELSLNLFKIVENVEEEILKTTTNNEENI